MSENWNTYKGNYTNNPIAEDRLRYDVMYHTDLSCKHGNPFDRDEKRQALQTQITKLQKKIKSEKQLNKQMELTARLKKLKKELEVFN